MRATITFKDAAWFFLPLIFWTELLWISHSVIHAFLARQPDPTVLLAGYNVAFAVVSALSSPSTVAPNVALAFVHDRRSLRQYFVFYALIMGPLLAVAVLTAVTPLGALIFGGLLGASAEAVTTAGPAAAIMALWYPAVVVRSVTTAMFMQNRRTFLVSIGTAVRLGTLFGSLLVLPYLFQGASMGAAALVGCIWTETLFSLMLAWRYLRRLPAAEGERVRLRDLWRFTWPLAVNQTSENGLLLCINFFMGRLASPDLALAAYGVVHGLVNLLLSPVRNLLQTAQALVRTREDLQVMVRFTYRVVLVFAVGMFALFYLPSGQWVLRSVMGLTAQLAAYAEPGLVVAFMVVVFWGYSALFRGLLSGARRTGSIALAAVIRVGLLGAVGSTVFFLPGLNGAVIGVVALMAAYMGEAYWLGARLFISRGHALRPLFPSRQAELPGDAAPERERPPLEERRPVREPLAQVVLHAAWDATTRAASAALPHLRVAGRALGMGGYRPQAARGPLTWKDVLRFYFPLIFTTEMNQVSHSVIYAFLARLRRPKISLAAYNLGFSLQQVLNSPTWPTQNLALAYLVDRRAVWRLVGFYWILMAAPWLTMQVVAWTPLGNWLFESLMGASPAAAEEAKVTVFIFTLIPPVVILRFLAAALFMLNRRTVLVTYGTMVRLAALGGFLAVLSHVLEGAAVGAAALALCIYVESAFTIGLAIPFYKALPRTHGEPERYATYWRYIWPLITSHLTENGAVFAINFFLGRLSQPDLALAAFGVVNGLTRLLLSPVRNLLQTTQALVRSRHDVAVLLRFTLGVTAFFVVGLVVLFYVPALRNWVLEDVMGLRDELSRYSTPGIQLSFLIAVFWAVSSYTKGVVAASKRTGSLAVSAAWRLVVTLGVSSMTLWVAGINGTVVGVLALAAAHAVEAVVLGVRLAGRLRRQEGALFRREPREGGEPR